MNDGGDQGAVDAGLVDAGLVEDLVALCRVFGMAERDQICCGTVTVPQCVCLQALLPAALEAGPLAERLGSSPSATTRLVDGLAKRGWVERARDASDRRRVQVQLTPSGEAQALELRTLTAQTVAAVMTRIPPEKHAQIAESLRLVRGAVEETSALTKGCCG